MSDLWTTVDDYLNDQLVAHDEALDYALRATVDAGLPEIQVSAPQGALLEILVRAQGGGRVLEIGTLGGYSSLWMARGLAAGGQVVTLEIDEHHAATARASFTAAGRSEQIEVRVGDARASLAQLRAEVDAGATLFDLVFIDADKVSMPHYFMASLPLVRPGALIVADNVIRDGHVADASLSATDDSVRGVRELFALVARTDGVVSTAIQTVGSKGYDGFALIRVEDPAAALRSHE